MKHGFIHESGILTNQNSEKKEGKNADETWFHTWYNIYHAGIGFTE